VEHVRISDPTPLGPQSIQDRLDVDRVPDDHRVRHEIQAARPVRLPLIPPAPDLALVGEEQEAPQRVQRLPFVELAIDASPVFRALRAPQDEHRRHQSAILLQCLRGGVLPRVALELPDDQGCGHIPHLERRRQAQDVVPATQEQVRIYRPLEQWLRNAVVGLAVQPIELLIAEVSNARRELQPEHVEQSDQDLGEARRVRRMFPDRQFRLVV